MERIRRMIATGVYKNNPVRREVYGLARIWLPEDAEHRRGSPELDVAPVMFFYPEAR
jgi:hypothetical protein